MKLAVYDLDRTLTRSGTYTVFLFYAGIRLAPLRMVFFPFWLFLMLGYVAKIYDRKLLKEMGIFLLIGKKVGAPEFIQICDKFAEYILKNNVSPEALAILSSDQSAGARLVLATASPDYYAVPLAARLGIGDVIATRQSRCSKGSYNWRIESENCYGDSKCKMLIKWLNDQQMHRDDYHIKFYTDSYSDLPTLRWVDEPIAANPSRKLRRLAQAENWAICRF